jgi:sugar/nucleoside kinase (ribokinase family)
MTGKILSIGEALVDLIPECTAPLSVADRFDRRPGDAPANVTIGLAQLTEPVGIATCVGEFSDKSLREYISVFSVITVDTTSSVNVFSTQDQLSEHVDKYVRYRSISAER